MFSFCEDLTNKQNTASGNIQYVLPPGVVLGRRAGAVLGAEGETGALAGHGAPDASSSTCRVAPRLSQGRPQEGQSRLESSPVAGAVDENLTYRGKREFIN